MKIIDLSTPLFSGMTVYPGDPEVKIKVVHTYEKETWELRQLTMGTHTGTHVDAFSHMDERAETIDQIPLNNFFGPTEVVKKNQKWPKEMGLLFIEEIGLAELDKILSVKPTFIGGMITEELERALLKNKIVTYTGLVNLECLPKQETFIFYGLPLKIKSGDGSPVRAIAIIED